MTRAGILHLVIGIAAVALFAESLRVLGVDQILAGLARVGWGFAVILLVAGARDVVRAVAWTHSVDGGMSLPLWPAVRARLAGEALNTLLPMGMVVGEPIKASHVSDRIPFATAARGLVHEFAFYTASLAFVFAAGVAAFAFLSGLGTWLPAVAPVGLATALVAAAFVRRVPLMSSLGLRTAAVIVACEVAYQALSLGELYYTLWLISPAPPTLASALVLETVNRAVTSAFKMVPLRVGVDEASSSFMAGQLHVDPAAGLVLALVRKLRLLVWSAVGLAMFARRRAPAVAGARPRTGLARLGAAATLVVLIAAVPLSAQQPSSTVSGSVSVVDPGGSPLAVPGVTLTLACGADAPRVEVSNEEGQFTFTNVTASGDCSIVAELQGFTSAKTVVRPAVEHASTVHLTLGLDTLREEVVVRAPIEAGDAAAIGAQVERITPVLMQTAPIASDRFQDALPLIPGVVRGPDGLLNINGTRSNESALTFNNANGTDPATGEDAIELPIDAVSSVQVRGAAYAPEYGLSAGAATSVETQRGGDTWDVIVNDLEPRVRRRGGEFKGIESWTPRVTLGGPIVKGKFALLESVQYEFSQTQVFGLPPLESDTKLQSFESYTRGDVVIDPTNRLTLSALVAPRKTTFAGLNTFNPQSVTADVKNHNLLVSAADQVIVGGSGVFDTRISVKQFDSTIYPSQGAAPMVLAPDRNSGSYFNDQERTSRRSEWFNTYSFTPFGEAHLVKVGGGFTYETVDGFSRSRDVRVVREDGSQSAEISFAGEGVLDGHKDAVRGFTQDTWTAGSRLTVVYGARYDYESISGHLDVSPRGSFAIVASADGRTVLRGGAGVFYNAIPLNVATFDRLQTRVVDGRPLPNLVQSDLRAPRSLNWNVEVDREWLKNLFVRAGYQQRDQRFESIVDATDSAIVLRADGRSRYREAQIATRYRFHGSDQLVASYTRSSSIGDLNDFNSFFGNLENPIIRPNERGPLPWDATHRVLVWGSVSLPHGFAIFPVLDVRTGFPLSNIDEDRRFVGPRNAVGRYPTFVSLDSQITKRFVVFRHHATLGLKVFNITDHFNPRDYQGNLASGNFGGFDNSVGRTFRGKWIFEF